MDYFEVCRRPVVLGCLVFSEPSATENSLTRSQPDDIYRPTRH